MAIIIIIIIITINYFSYFIYLQNPSAVLEISNISIIFYSEIKAKIKYQIIQMTWFHIF